MAGEADTSLTWGAQLAYGERILAEAGSPEPRREAAELLSRLVGMPAPLLDERPATLMSAVDARRYASWVARRAGGVPIPYITGHLEFMGLDITVRWDSPLVPTGAQLLVETALQWARSRTPDGLIAAEVGAGCGAITLALAALEPRWSRIYAVDAASEALAMARENGARYLLNLVITWIEGGGLDALPEPVDLIVCGRTGNGQRVEQTPLFNAPALAQLSALLKPGGALMCALSDGKRLAAIALLAQALPTAHLWTTPVSNGAFIVVAQLPPAPAA
jgi:precorrin-6B methylase 2